MLDIRLMGDPKEIEAAIAEIKTLPRFRVLKVSKPYPNRGDDGVRVYVNVEVRSEENSS